MHDKTFQRLCLDAEAAGQYWHFALPCKSFSRLSINLNGGTRTNDKPWGSGELGREILGNKLLERTVLLIQILIRHGSYWSLENPRTSLVFRMPTIVDIQTRSDTHVIHFDQCMYGLKFDDSSPHERCQKPTRIITNLSTLKQLEQSCDHSHVHIHAVGGFRGPTGWTKRSTAAAAYPDALCERWAGLAASKEDRA